MKSASIRQAYGPACALLSCDRLVARYNVLSELRRPKPAPKVVAFVAAQQLADLYVSSVTFAEIRFGIERLEDAGRRAEMNDWLQHTLRPMFSERVLPVSEDVMLRWRVMVEGGRKAGHTFSQPDLIIAATAAQHGLTVVSRDTDDYVRASVPVHDPWSDADSKPGRRG